MISIYSLLKNDEKKIMDLLNSDKYTPGKCYKDICYYKEVQKGVFDGSFNGHCRKIILM